MPELLRIVIGLSNVTGLRTITSIHPIIAISQVLSFNTQVYSPPLTRWQRHHAGTWRERSQPHAWMTALGRRGGRWALQGMDIGKDSNNNAGCMPVDLWCKTSELDPWPFYASVPGFMALVKLLVELSDRACRPYSEQYQSVSCILNLPKRRLLIG